MIDLSCSSDESKKLLVTALPSTQTSSMSRESSFQQLFTEGPLIWLTASVGADKSRLFTRTQLDVCSSSVRMRSFTRLETNTNQIVIETTNNDENNDNNDETKFLISFEAVSTKQQSQQCALESGEIRCTQQYTVESTTYQHQTCIRRDLMCNCDSLVGVGSTSNSTSSGGGCKRLSGDLLLIASSISARLCDYYADLNSQCLRKRITRVSTSNEGADGFYDDVPLSLVEDRFDEPDPVANDDDFELGQFDAYNSNKQTIPSSYFADSGDFCTNVVRTGDFGWIASPNFYEYVL